MTSPWNMCHVDAAIIQRDYRDVKQNKIDNHNKSTILLLKMQVGDIILPATSIKKTYVKLESNKRRSYIQIGGEKWLTNKQIHGIYILRLQETL